MFFALHERIQNKAPQLTRIALIAVSAGTAIMVAGGNDAEDQEEW
jgi:hypothetical protein